MKVPTDTDLVKAAVVLVKDIHLIGLVVDIHQQMAMILVQVIHLQVATVFLQVVMGILQVVTDILQVVTDTLQAVTDIHQAVTDILQAATAIHQVATETDILAIDYHLAPTVLIDIHLVHTEMTVIITVDRSDLKTDFQYDQMTDFQYDRMIDIQYDQMTDSQYDQMTDIRRFRGVRMIDIPIGLETDYHRQMIDIQ